MNSSDSEDGAVCFLRNYLIEGIESWEFTVT
jgi:hypothetical protein